MSNGVESRDQGERTRSRSLEERDAVRRWTTTSAALFLALTAFASSAQAADESDVLRARAAQLASNDNCAAALPLLERAAEIDPAGDSSMALLKGRCLLSQEEFDAATPLLEEAVAADPNSGEAAIALGMSRYHQGLYSSARTELERAERLLPNRPEPPLYIGLILLDAEESAAAAAQLDRSSSLSSDGFDPAANYYAALAHAGAGDGEQAVASLERVEELAAGTPYAARARDARLAAENRRAGVGGNLRRWVTLNAGLDFDTNVQLRSDRISSAADIGGRRDGRAWWGADLGADLFRKDGWSAGIGADYTGNAYFKESEFNQHFVTGSVWLDRTLGADTTLHIEPEGGFGFFNANGGFDDAEYLRFYGIRSEIRHNFGKAGVGSLNARYAFNDFGFPRLAPELDRDGHEIQAGYDHSLRAGERTTLRGGVFARHYISQGTEFDRTGAGAWLGISRSLPWKLTLDVSGSVAYDIYDRESVFVPDPAVDPPNTQHREDLIGTASAVLTRPITDWLSVSARWNYLNSESNTEVFDYDRHIVGAFFTIGFVQPGGLFWGNNS